MLYAFTDPKLSAVNNALAAPSAGSSPAMRLPGDQDLPPPYVDERLVEPETRAEMFRGRRIVAAPANPEHGDEHAALDYLARGDLAPGYVASTDLLTRAGKGSDFATDTCIRRAGTDPRTGSRYLEELAFEVVNNQTLAHMIERAQQLTTCGVRRIFAVFVKTQQVGEWSPTEGRFVMLGANDMIEDPTLVRPLPVRALFSAVEADNSVVRALETKGNPVIDEIRAGGRIEGLTDAVELLCPLLGIPLGLNERAHMSALDVEGLRVLLRELQTERRWPRS